MDADSTLDYFADGTTEPLITERTKISTVGVISRTAIMQYIGAHRPLLRITLMLQIDAIMEGSLLDAGRTYLNREHYRPVQ